MNTTTEYPPLTERQLYDIKPDDRLLPKLFTGAIGATAVTVTMPFGIDLLFTRGATLTVGISALREVTIELISDYHSAYRPGGPDFQDKMSIVPTRRLQIPRERVFVSGGLTSLEQVEKFGRTHPSKAFVTHTRSILLTFG